MESTDGIKRIRVDVRRALLRPDGSQERQTWTFSEWRAWLSARTAMRLLLVAVWVALYVLGGQRSMDALVRWLVAAGQ